MAEACRGILKSHTESLYTTLIQNDPLPCFYNILVPRQVWGPQMPLYTPLIQELTQCFYKNELPRHDTGPIQDLCTLHSYPYDLPPSFYNILVPRQDRDPSCLCTISRVKRAHPHVSAIMRCIDMIEASRALSGPMQDFCTLPSIKMTHPHVSIIFWCLARAVLHYPWSKELTPLFLQTSDAQI